MTTQLDAAYQHEKNLARRTWLTQPLGGGPIKDYDWAEAMNEARRMAAALRAKGYPPGSRIAIFSKNTAWWFITDLAIMMAGHVSVPIYPNLAAGSIRQILEHSESKLIFIGKLDGYESMASGIPDSLERVIMPLGPSTPGTKWADIIQSTAPLEDSPRRDPDELATIMYTSGSTGQAKGVMHSFRTMCAARVFIDSLGVNLEDRMISYLPLAHVAERGILETPNFLVGFHVYFAESLDTFVQDLQRARPTLFGSVPRLWLKFQSGVFEKMPKKKLDTLLKIPVVNGLVRKKILKGLGLDQTRLTVSGSAPIPADLLRWYRGLGLEMGEIYGMTENFAISHMTRVGDFRPGWVGAPVKGVEHRLAEGDEVQVKSPGTMLGYYKAEELTRDALTEDGWLRTGDRGEVDPQQNLRLTGRVKELFKTSKGKYVSPARIENLLLANPNFEQACVLGVGMSQPFALVVLSQSARKIAANGRDAVAPLVAEALARVNAEVDPHEQLAKLVVVGEEWTPENGMLTPTLKLKRGAIEAKYSPMAEGWYAQKPEILWA
ncbi:AMP-binding protein [Myxococcota bacterium]|nr:AMP-binding protein [Myxococcota bacterium]